MNLDYSTIVETPPAHWTDLLGAGFAEHTQRVEQHLAERQDYMWKLRPGAPSDMFQRYAGEIAALKWVLALVNSQKPKPGVST